MDLTSPKIIKEILKKHETRPSKTMGQNFLIDKNVLKKIIETAQLKPTDTVLEVGPGIGTLTQELAKHAGKVIAVEKDRKMTEILKETLADFKNIEIIQGDILKLNSKPQIPKPNQAPNPKTQKENWDFFGHWALEFGHYKLVANLPYYITSPVIRKFLENPPAGGPPSEMVLMVQKEVAQRICSKPPNMSILAVSVQFYAKPEIIGYVSKSCFWPAPKIDSAIIKIIPKIGGLPMSSNFTNLFFKVVKAGFSHPRKQLENNFSKALSMSREEVKTWLSKNNIFPAQRAETLSVEDWKNLAKSFPQVD